MRPASVLFVVFGFILICCSNFSQAKASYQVKDDGITATFNSANLATIFGDNTDDDVHAHTSRVNRRGQNVRRICEKDFLKEAAVEDQVADNPIPPADLFRSLIFGSEEYLLRPFYYVLLFRYALF